MRKLVLLAAALLAGSSAANAAPIVYGVSFIGTNLWVERGFEPAFYRAQKDFTGQFTFDSATNQLISLSAEFIGPRSTNPAPSTLFNAAQPCDLQCFIGALESGSFYYNYSSGAASLSFGDPLNGTVTAPGFVSVNTRSEIRGIVRVNGAIPEPGTWLMMLLGFGAIGVSVRRRSAKQFLMAPSR